MNDRASTNASDTYPRTVQLAFEGKEKFEYVDDPIYKDLSAATRHVSALFVCCDETAGVDRLTSVADGGYAEHAHFNLGDLVNLPDGPDGEMDIEGLDVDGDWLWIVGSHSLKRDKPESDDSAREALKRVTSIKRDPKRAFLARLPLSVGQDGSVPAAEDGERRIAHLKTAP